MKSLLAHEIQEEILGALLAVWIKTSGGLSCSDGRVNDEFE